MQFETRTEKTVTVVTLKGRMDVVAALDFEKRCGALVDGGATDMAIDLDGLEYISSAGLRGILAIAKKIQQKNGKIRFCNLKGIVKDVFGMTGFDAMFPIFDSLDKALA